MKTKEGDVMKSAFDGEEYIITKVVNEMVVLKSNDGRKQIMTGMDSLKIFYEKKEDAKP